jgi:inhibitor of cysteine peptidase
MITLDENSDGRQIELSKGQELEVVLPANPTTGFRWRLETSAEPALAAQGDSYAAPGAAASGRAGTHRWRFRAENAGRGTISLALRRPWETKGAADRTFQVEVHVPQG